MDTIDDPLKVPSILSRHQALVASKIEEKGQDGGGVRYLPGRQSKSGPLSLKSEEVEDTPPSEEHRIDVVV